MAHHKGPPAQGPAPPIQPLVCSADGCGYSTPEGVPDFAAQLTCLSLHTKQAHPVQIPEGAGTGPARPTCKVDNRSQPIVASEMSET